MDKKLPVYEMFLTEDDMQNEEFGVFTVSLVDKPAIIAQYMAFAEECKAEFKFKVVDEKQKIICGPVMIPGMPIYRVDEKTKKEYYVTASGKTIELTNKKFMADGLTKAVNMMHESNLLPKDVVIFESKLISKLRGNIEPVGYKKCPENTWFITMDVSNNIPVWEEYIETGILRGFSIEGNFRLKEVAIKPASFLEDMESLLGNRNL